MTMWLQRESQTRMTVLDQISRWAIHVARRVRRKARRAARVALGRDLAPALLANVLAARNDVAALHADLDGSRQALRDLRNELAGQVSFLAHDLGEQLAAFTAQSGNDLNLSLQLNTDLGLRFDALSSAQSELQNRLVHVESSLQSRLNELHTAAFEAQNRLIHLDTSLHSRFNEILSAQLPGILEQVHQVCALQLDATHSSRTIRRAPQGAVRPDALRNESFEDVLARARKDFPTVFAAWKERLDEIGEAFSTTMTGNAAHGADIYSRLFRVFVERYADGAVLDVGCGPFGKPFYLSTYPSELVAGIEPLPVQQDGEIQLVRGISEYLPWPDQSFSTVISATSLDHCLSLDRSIDETIRVLRPDGKLLLWLGSVPGARAFVPNELDFTPADRFHLFHFDIAWFEPMLESRFLVADRVKLDRAGYSHVFYCLTLKNIGAR